MTTTLPPSGDTPAELAEHLASGARLVEAFHLMPGVARAMREAARLLRKPCTCHPDDNPPVPCPQKYALSECRAAAPPAAQGDPYFLGLAHTLLKALKRLSFAAQTACGTAGLDTELVDAIAEAERAIEKSKGYPAAPPATQQQAEPAFDWRFSHHYTAENIAAIVQDLKSVENGNESPLWKDRDHRTRAGILWRVISALSHDVPTAVQQQAEPANDPVTLARLFHATYERLAPEYGYETRPDTKDFDPESKNGRLMVRVCAEISNAVFCPTPAVQQQVERAYEDRSWDDATENAALVILHTVMQDNADGFQQWYKPEQWLGIHRAVAAYIVMHYKAAPPAVQAEPVAWLDPSDPDADSCIVLDRIRKHGKDNGMEWWKRYTVPLCAVPPADDEAVRLLERARQAICEQGIGKERRTLIDAIDAYLARVVK